MLDAIQSPCQNLGSAMLWATIPLFFNRVRAELTCRPLPNDDMTFESIDERPSDAPLPKTSAETPRDSDTITRRFPNSDSAVQDPGTLFFPWPTSTGIQQG